MSNLPSGWETVRLADVTDAPTVVDWQMWAPPTFTYIDIGSIDSQVAEITSPKQLPLGDAPSRARQVVRAGDTIFSTVRTYLRKIAYVHADLDGQIASTGFCVLRPSAGMVPRYIYYHCQSSDFIRDISNQQRGVSYPAVTDREVRAMSIPVPPREEQERIVAAIEEQFSRLDAGVAAMESARQKLKRMRTAVLQAAVTGRLLDPEDTEGTADSLLVQAAAARDSVGPRTGRGGNAPLDYVHEHLPAIPSSWRWVSLDAIAHVVGGITKDAKKQRSPHLVEVPYLRVANVQRGYLDLRSVTTIKTTPEQVAALVLEAGDVLFNEGGDRDKLGRGWIWEGQLDPCIHQNHVFRARLYAPVLDPRLLSWHGNTFGQRWFDRGGKQTTNLASVNKTTLRSFPVPIPPLAEQRRIVAAAESYLSLIDAGEAMVQADEQRVAGLRNSILATAFSGSLVPQNPNDEPVAVLLDRIAAERDASNGRSRTDTRKFTPRQKVSA